MLIVGVGLVHAVSIILPGLSMKVLVCVVLVVFGAQQGTALPDGPPVAACSNGFTPQHDTHVPQSSMIPFNLDLSDFPVSSSSDSMYYVPGVTYSCELFSMTCVAVALML